MKKAIRTIWLIAVGIVFVSMIWFLLGSTACFQRSIDLVTTVIFIIAWVPALCFIVFSLLAIKKNLIPNKKLFKIILTISIILISSIFTSTFINNASPYGWLKEIVDEDYMQITLDEKYEYRLEIINRFQKNSYVRVYLKEISDGEEMRLKLDIPARDIYVVSGGIDSIYPEPEIPPVWSKLIPTDNESIYILTTTDLFDNDKSYRFYVDVESNTVTMIQ